MPVVEVEEPRVTIVVARRSSGLDLEEEGEEDRNFDDDDDDDDDDVATTVMVDLMIR